MIRSVIAALIAAAWGLLSMGFMGIALYYLAAPALWPFFGDFEDWRGDDVWPAMIAAGMLWSCSFLVAGWLNRRLVRANWSNGRRRAVYVLVLWLGAVAVWLLMLATMDIGPAAA